MEDDLVIHVDDSRTAREMVREALEDAGFRVLSAEDGQDLEHRVMQEEDIRNTVSCWTWRCRTSWARRWARSCPSYITSSSGCLLSFTPARTRNGWRG